jgi:isoleucyl-tRNA synthetase
LNLKSTEETVLDQEALRRSAPQDVEAYYFNIVEEVNELTDWCISEDTAWGVPVPYFTRREDPSQVLADQEIARHVARVFREQGGSDAWYRLPVAELLPPRYRDQAAHLVKGTQAFDVWFDNALSWGFTEDFHERNPLSIEVRERLSQLPPDSHGGLLRAYQDTTY